MKQSAGARQFLAAFADGAPLFAVFRSANLLERLELAGFFQLHLKVRDIVVFRVVQIAQQDLVHLLHDPLRVGFDGRLCLGGEHFDAEHENLVRDRPIEELNGLGHPLGSHLLQEK